jgi:hypothetical protein
VTIRQLRCFGGPRDGEMIPTARGDVVYVAVPFDRTWSIHSDSGGATFKRERYDVQGFTYSACPHSSNLECTMSACEATHWFGECLVYNRRRGDHIQAAHEQLCVVGGIARTMGMR